MTKPLDGIRVIDMHRYSPGQYCTMNFADFGADVIKVEEPLGMRFGEETDASRRPSLNRGKRSIVLNLKEPDGKAIFRRLADQADIIVEGFRPGVMERLGLGYDALAARNPRLIYCAISGFGQEGPYRDRAGHDLNYTALGGMLGLTGHRAGAPVQAGIQMADLAGGAMPAVIGVLMALFARERTGKGQFVDIGILDGVTSWLLAQVDGILAGAQAGRGETVLNGGAGYYGVYETRDGRYVTLAALEPWFWSRFCEIVDRHDLLPLHGVGQNQEQLRSELQGLFRTRTLSEWETLLASEDVCYAPVLSPTEVLRQDHLTARDTVRPQGPGEDRRPIGMAVKLRGTPADGDRPAPRRGEHTRAILAELDCPAAEIEALLSRGICQ